MLRCERAGSISPTLAEFVLSDDIYMYGIYNGMAGLMNQAELRIENQTSSTTSLYQALEQSEITNEERLRPNWDQYFMQLASLAARRSNCMKRRVGCVLIREKRVISTGYNGTPRNLRNCNEGGCEFFPLLLLWIPLNVLR